jgi:hypothetical protein
VFRDISDCQYLAGDILVGESDDETVLGGVVLIFNLNNKALSGIVICLSRTSALELNLEALEVCLVLDNFAKPCEKRAWKHFISYFLSIGGVFITKN